ncbi:hypothetical protein BB560_004955 [Smittium megazygosporum]|uniref:FAM32A-like n=1 Tax=Smittium megazygosporum TaxID=133381 RepID=A0A2T9Z7U0_9FUNG|nr:hypothetical protein BB560_004955 [Smittium megazygosporum]
MSEYDLGSIRAPLSLKKKKKKRKSTKSKSDLSDQETVVLQIPKETSTKNSNQISSILGLDQGLTESEKRHKKILLERREKKIQKFISKSHKEKVKEFNERLERLPEHNEMPKVGPG